MPHIGVVVLAAGAGKRFGGGKLLAELDGRPLLRHVLDAVRATRPGRCVVVVGDDAERLRSVIAGGDETSVVNPDPAAGLSGSVRLGVRECLRLMPGAQGVLVVLGDQPRISPEVIRALAGSVRDASAAGAWAVVPSYADGGGANPALLLQTGLEHVPTLRGDRGLGALLDAEPGRAFRVPLAGSNPDVDTQADLRALADGPREGGA